MHIFFGKYCVSWFKFFTVIYVNTKIVMLSNFCTVLSKNNKLKMNTDRKTYIHTVHTDRQTDKQKEQTYSQVLVS